jgi:thymidylate synthase
VQGLVEAVGANEVRPARDLTDQRDIPCTLGYRFYVRDTRLHMHTTMRSQDTWLGLPYDLFATTTVMELMAGWLDVDLGGYHHHVDSLHLYVER